MNAPSPVVTIVLALVMGFVLIKATTPPYPSYPSAERSAIVRGV